MGDIVLNALILKKEDKGRFDKITDMSIKRGCAAIPECEHMFADASRNKLGSSQNRRSFAGRRARNFPRYRGFLIKIAVTERGSIYGKGHYTAGWRCCR